MNVTWSQVALILLPVVVGTLIGVAPTILLERSRNRTAFRTRWDATIEERSAEFAATARRILDLVEQYPHLPASVAPSIREEHGRLQRLMAGIRLLAGPSVQLAARRVVRHAWALQVLATTGVDPRAADYPADGPRERTLSSLYDFYRAVRGQLRVPEAESLIPLNPPTSAELTGRPRSAPTEKGPNR
jgi:hypothetical protein